MATRIPPIERAVVVLDQAAGELREDNGEVVGLDLWPETEAAFARAGRRGLDLTLVVPGGLDGERLSGLSDRIGGLRIATVSGRFIPKGGEGTASRLSENEPPTALVAADRCLRGQAARSGLYPAPHAALLPMMMQGWIPDAVRIVGPREPLQRLGLREDVVPMHFQPTLGGAWALIALVSAEAAAVAAVGRLQVSQLPCDPMTEDLLWARIDGDGTEIRAALARRRLLHSEPGQVLLALGPEEDPQALAIHGSHGHCELLVPDPNLMRPAIGASLASDALDPAALVQGALEPVATGELERRAVRILRPPCSTITAEYESDIDRYAGAAALDADGPIVSRHTAHPDNQRAQAALLADLGAIGYSPYRHDFTHAGQTLSNIIADLPGTGLLRVRQELLAHAVSTLCTHPGPPGGRRSALAELARADWLEDAAVAGISDADLERRITRLLRLHPWYPWWKSHGAIAGYGADLIIVGCHLDSTAGFDAGYRPALDPAPGRDDNASGIAAVLALARDLWSLRGRLTHTVRFCFFNAEEAGLVGSKAYAAKMKSLDAPIRAAICMDMIGYNGDADRTFEIHAGYTDPAIRDLSLPVADRLAVAAASQKSLAPAQVYRGTSWNGAPDRAVFDGAINRSDHAAFHQQGYAAVLLSEDFFANLGSEPAADPNPNYHRGSDAVVDLDYACNIVCAARQAIVDLAA